MAKISLTDFVDIVAKSANQKATKVRQVKDRPDYMPAYDFYKSIREHIIKTHQSGQGRGSLIDVLSDVTDPKKSKAYPDIVAGYRKWWGRKSFEWFAPPRSDYGVGKVQIMVNPEIGLAYEGRKHVFKLYFKEAILKSGQARIITDLLEHVLRPSVDSETHFGVLDIRRSKLFSGTPGRVEDMAMVNAEMAYIESIWG